MVNDESAPEVDDVADQTSAATKPDNGQSTHEPTDGQPPPSVQQTANVDETNVVAGYANFCRVSSTPEELILDLGLNANPYSGGEVTIRVSQRIILNHYTAKRLANALALALQRHEQAFGVLETDVRKRIQTQ